MKRWHPSQPTFPFTLIYIIWNRLHFIDENGILQGGHFSFVIFMAWK